MGFTIETGVSAAAVFLQGLLSFFSPCVLPLVPLYLGYLSGGISTGIEEEKKGKLRLFLRVLCFTLGISAAFFVLGLSASAAGSFLNERKMLFARVGGVLIVLFGLYQLGVFGKSKLLGEEHRIPFHLEKMTMSPVTALVMGFTFSFAWTPCVGPALASVLLMAGSAQSSVKGFLLIGVYTVGFILPFLAAGLFTSQLLGVFRKHMSVVRYTVKIGGLLMILMGVLMFTGKMNNITGYLSTAGQESGSGTERADSENESGSPKKTDGTSGENDSKTGEDDSAKEGSGDAESSDSAKEDSGDTGSSDSAKEDSGDTRKTPAYGFELKDQYGDTHRLSDYKGKVIFLNFWATWCPPCKAEMPDIQKLYEEYSGQGEEAEVVILGVAAPDMGQEGSEEEIASFMEENDYTYPVLMDTRWEMFNWYGISSFPTTFMIDKNGDIFGYVTGQMSEDIMRSIISQTLEGK